MLSVKMAGDVQLPDAVADEGEDGSGFDDTLHELLSMPGVEPGNPLQDINIDRAEDNEMNGVVSHDHGPGPFGEVDWESVDSAFSTEGFDLQSSLGLSLLHTASATPENLQASMNHPQNGYCIFEGLGTMTPLSTTTASKGLGLFDEQQGANLGVLDTPSSITTQTRKQNHQSQSQEQQQESRTTKQTDGQ